MAHYLYERTVRARRKAFRHLVFLLFKPNEFDLYKFVLGEFRVRARYERFGDSVAAYFEDGFQELRFTSKGASVGRCQLRLQEMRNRTKQNRIQAGTLVPCEQECD